MAEPVDYFLQGANLGMNAAQFGARQRQDDFQFRTNLAERARQYDLNREIALNELDLKTKEYTLQQEQHQVDQQLRMAQITQTKLRNDEMRQQAEDITKYAPVLQSYTSSLQQWNGRGEPPFIPDNLPLAQRNEAMALRSHAMDSARNNTTLILEQKALASKQEAWNEGLMWMIENDPNGIVVENGQINYDFSRYQRQRSQANQLGRSIRLSEAMVNARKAGPKSEKEQYREFFNSNMRNFIVTPEDGREPYFDSKSFAAAWRAYLDPASAVTGVPKSDEEMTLQDLTGPNFMPMRDGSLGF